MRYDEVIAGAFEPSPPGVRPAPTVDASPARRFRDAIEPIAMHSVWSRTTNEALAELGLDFMTSYVWGRASALGEPETGVVVSTFAVFAPELIGAIYEQGRAACDRDRLITVRTEATTTSLTEALGDAEVDAVADALQAAVSAADATARPLFAGFQTQPWPDDAVGRLWHACELAREHRGDSHNAVCIAEGLGPVEMNVLTELWLGMPLGSYSGTRGWSPDRIAESAEGLRAQGWLDGDRLSSEGRARRDSIEARTDAMEQGIIDALGDDLESVIARLDEWSRRCVDAAAFPPNAFKRAAG